MRGEILDAASQLINHGGVDHLTMRTLGKQVGVTAATLYGYFASREAVLEALLEEKMGAMNGALGQAAAGIPAGAQRLLAYAVGYRQFARSSPDFYGMFISKVEPPDWDKIATGEDQRSVVLYNLHKEIQLAIDSGEMYSVSPSAVCRVLWTVAHGYVTLERTDCFDTARLPEQEQMLRYLEHFLLASKGLFTPSCFADLSARISSFAGISEEGG